MKPTPAALRAPAADGPPSRRRARLEEVPLDERPVGDLREHLAGDAWPRLMAASASGRLLLQDRTVWWVNATALGGGIAEMHRTLLPYWRGAEIDARWLVTDAPTPFFRVTKRLHNLLHGVPLRAPTPAEAELFEKVSRSLSAQAAGLVAPGDVVILQDPQAAGLVTGLRRAGAVVIWRCHVGADHANGSVAAAWRFLLPHIAEADAFVFTRRAYVPPALDPRRTFLLMPAIDPGSVKNRPLAPQLAQGLLQQCGLAQAPAPAAALASVRQGRLGVPRPTALLQEGPPPRLGRERIVAALARWDRLKDPVGTMQAFAEHVEDPKARLIVAGPAPGSVADDPEAKLVFAQARRVWQSLPKTQRRRVQLASLRMADPDANALVVNALQRQAAVVVKKSLHEGFGLGVTEGMWKARPVVATRVGGHQDQIEHGRSGLLVDDPDDLAGFGAAIDQLLAEPAHAFGLAAAARESVGERFLADRHLVEWIAVLARILRSP